MGQMTSHYCRMLYRKQKPDSVRDIVLSLLRIHYILVFHSQCFPNYYTHFLHCLKEHFEQVNK